MSNVVDFALQKFSGQGDSRVIPYQQALLLELSKDMFSPFSVPTFILLNPDIDSAIIEAIQTHYRASYCGRSVIGDLGKHMQHCIDVFIVS
jgi:hypothetical protein